MLGEFQTKSVRVKCEVEKRENEKYHFTRSPVFRIIMLTKSVTLSAYQQDLPFLFYSIRFVEHLVSFPLSSKDLSSAIKRLNTLPSNDDLLHRAKMPSPTLIFLSK